MKENNDSQFNARHEVNLKLIFQKIYRYKLYFISSILLCTLLAFLLIKFITPQYEVSTSILIEANGGDRALGNSQYVEGGVSLMELEKNLYNEIGIIKSFSLIAETVKDLDFDTSYYAENWLQKKEYYQHFPFKVVLTNNQSQLYGNPFEVTPLSDEKYRLSIDGDDFQVSDANSGRFRPIGSFSFSKEFKFGEQVKHQYFNFILDKSETNFNSADFEGKKLSFNINNENSLADSYMAKIEVANIDLQASIFKIVTEGPIINKEIDFLQKLTENYVQNQLKSRSEVAMGKESFIKDQLRGIADSLSKVEAKLAFYKKDKRALNLGATATNALRKTSDLQVNRSKVQMEMNFYQSLIQSLEESRNSEDFEIPTAVGIEDPLINANILELKQLYATRANKRFFVTNNNEEISMLNRQIQASTDLLLNNLRNAVKSSEFRLERINTSLKNYDGVITSLPTRGKRTTYY